MTTAYDEQTWADGETGGTPESAARFNHMEAGIAATNAGLIVLEGIVADLESGGADIIQFGSGTPGIGVAHTPPIYVNTTPTPHTLYVYNSADAAWELVGGSGGGGTPVQFVSGEPDGGSDTTIPFYLDTASGWLWVWDGTSWDTVTFGENLQIDSGVPDMSTPTVPPFYYSTGDGILYVYDGGGWDPAMALPAAPDPKQSMSFIYEDDVTPPATGASVTVFADGTTYLNSVGSGGDLHPSAFTGPNYDYDFDTPLIVQMSLDLFIDSMDPGDEVYVTWDALTFYAKVGPLDTGVSMSMVQPPTFVPSGSASFTIGQPVITLVYPSSTPAIESVALTITAVDGNYAADYAFPAGITAFAYVSNGDGTGTVTMTFDDTDTSLLGWVIQISPTSKSDSPQTYWVANGGTSPQDVDLTGLTVGDSYFFSAPTTNDKGSANGASAHPFTA